MSYVGVVGELTVGHAVAREDGRHYVPVTITRSAKSDLSPIVLRVASDAFDTLDDAIEFANEVERRWNLLERNS
jgi:hypothetical protein